MSLKKFDLETNSVIKTGCATAEREAISRYGLFWRKTYLETRICLRRKQYPILNRMFPYNNPLNANPKGRAA